MLNNGLILPGDQLDSVTPINWEHPLNRGLVGDYSLITGGGSSIRDLTGGVMGAITGAPQFVGSSRLNGLNALRFTATSGQYVTMASSGAKLFPSATQATFAIWHRKTDTTARNNFALSYQAGVLSERASAHLPWSDNVVLWDWTGAATANTRATYSWVPDTNWHLWVFTVGGGIGMRIYKDGVQVAANNGTTPTRTVSNSNVGIMDSSFTDLVEIGSALFYNRCLSASEVVSLYQEELAGNPNRWTWRSTRFYSFYQTTPAVAILDGPCPGTPRDSWSGNQSRSYSVTAGDVILVKLSGTDFTADVTATYAP